MNPTFPLRIRRGSPRWRAKPQKVDGLSFASKAEMRRYGVLTFMVKTGEIEGLRLHPEFPIVVNGVKVCTYVADFAYREHAVDAVEPRLVVEDVKSPMSRTRLYELKKKLMAAVHGIHIRETR